MKDYALYTAFNDDCLEIGLNMLYSFFYNNRWFDGDIIILCDKGECGGLSMESRRQILDLSDKIIFKDDCYEIYKNIIEHCKDKTDNQGTLICYYKLELLKKNEYKVKVYLDADTIVNKDIYSLFVNKNNIRNAACLDFGICDGVQNNFQIASRLHPKEKNEYFNAGVMCVKNDFVREGLYDDAIQFCESFTDNDFKHPLSLKGKLVDQDMFNELLENVDIIPYIYNLYASSYADLCSIYERTLDNDCIKMMEETSIIHYCGRFKPYKKNENKIIYKAFDIYYRYDYFRRHKLD